MYAYHLVDEVAERFLDLIDGLDDSIDDLEDRVAEQSIPASGRTLRELRHDVLGIRRVLGPTRDAVRKIVDNRIELDSGELFPRNVEISFGNAYDKLLRASEALDASRDSLGGVRDYVQGKIANDQNEVTKRLTVIASLLLVPTFIVGVYGQNFRRIPELHWGFGYAWSWGLIIVTTLAQLAFFRWKRWI
jgi:magnesium transporter